MCSPFGLRESHRLVGVDHDVEGRPDRFADGAESLDILLGAGLADLQLHARPALPFGLEGAVDKVLGGEMQPAAFGVVERNCWARATGQAPERLASSLLAPVPEGEVHGRASGA